MRGLLLLLGCCLCAGATATWEFDAPIDLTATEAGPHFHHLDGAGRRHVAAGGGGVAVAWEDDSSGDPQVYIAIRPASAGSFSVRHRLSDGNEAYEPALVATGHGGAWATAWEQDGTLRARLVDEQGAGPVLQLAGEGARQVSLASDGGGNIAAAWIGDNGRRVEFTLLRSEGRQLAMASPASVVSPVSDNAHRGYPSIAWASGGRLAIAWEDRRAGHTRLFYRSRGGDGGFSPERQLNEHNNPPPEEAGEHGLGSGVMRVMLAADGSGGVRAIWLDKRNPASGYAVWGAVSSDGGRHFGPNAMVQDEQGAAVPQWHAALAGRNGLYVAAWDDTRESWGDDAEPGDVILTSNDGSGWVADQVVPVASGAGYQGSPAVALDGAGRLHLVWIERADLSAPSRLMYATARRGD